MLQVYIPNNWFESLPYICHDLYYKWDDKCTIIISLLGLGLIVIVFYLEYSNHDKPIDSRENLKRVDKVRLPVISGKNYIEISMERQCSILFESILRHCESLVDGNDPEVLKFHWGEDGLLRRGLRENEDKTIVDARNITIKRYKDNLLRIKHGRSLFRTDNIKELKFADISDADIESALAQITWIMNTLKLWIGNGEREIKLFDNLTNYFKDILGNLEDRKVSLNGIQKDLNDREEYLKVSLFDPENMKFTLTDDERVQNKICYLYFRISGISNQDYESPKFKLRFKYIYLARILINYCRFVKAGIEPMPLALHWDENDLLRPGIDPRESDEDKLERDNAIAKVRKDLMRFGKGDIVFDIDRSGKGKREKGNFVEGKYYELVYIGNFKDLRSTEKDYWSFKYQVHCLINLLGIFDKRNECGNLRGIFGTHDKGNDPRVNTGISESLPCGESNGSSSVKGNEIECSEIKDNDDEKQLFTNLTDDEYDEKIDPSIETNRVNEFDAVNDPDPDIEVIGINQDKVQDSQGCFLPYIDID